MADVVRWVDTQEEEQVRWGLELAGDDAAATAFSATTMRDERTRSNVYATAETVLAAFADPGGAGVGSRLGSAARSGSSTAAATRRTCARRLTSSDVCSRYSRRSSRRSSPHAYERATETGKPLDPPLLLVLDECANIAPLRELATLASTGAGQGIQLVSVFQDMAQINAVYGRDRAPTIVSNHRAKVILSGVADAQTLDYVGRLLGDEEVRQVSSTTGAEGRTSTTESVALPQPGARQRPSRDATGPRRARVRPPAAGADHAAAVVPRPAPTRIASGAAEPVGVAG